MMNETAGADPLTSAASDNDCDEASVQESERPSPELTLAGSRTQFGQEHRSAGDEPDDADDINEIVAATDVRPRLQLRSETLRETKDLFITVDDPFKKVSTMETFVLYRIRTNSKRPEFSNKEMHEVRRRYSDFDYLRAQLAERFPTRVVPPLPDKHSLTSIDRFDALFIERRGKALQRFLGRVGDNAVLSSANVLVLFLTADQPDFDHFRKTHPISGGSISSSSSGGLFSKIGKSQQRPASDSSSPATTQSAGVSQVSDEQLAEADRDIEALAGVFSSFEKSAYRLAKELRDLSQEEADLAEALYGLQLAEDNWPSSCSAADAARQAARAASDSVKLTDELAEFVSEEVGQPMHEYMLYARTVRDAAGRARAVRAEQAAAVDAVERLRSKPTASRGRGDEQKLQQLEAKAERISDVASSCSADLLADVERWRAEKRRDTRELLHGLAAANADSLNAMMRAWDAAQQYQSTSA